MSFEPGDLVQIGTRTATYRVTKVLKNGWLRLETLDGSMEFRQHEDRDCVNAAQGDVRSE